MDDRTSPPGPTLRRVTSGQRRPVRPRRAGARRFLIAAGVLLVVFGGYFAYANRPIVVEVAAPEENVRVRVFGLGAVEARIRSDIGFEVGATLAELVADEGDHVRKGDLLARLLPGEQEARLEKARAALLVAEASVAKADANVGKTNAILAQKKDANRRKQALAGRNVISEQSAEEALRDEAIAEADVMVAASEVKVAEAMLGDARAQLRFEEAMLRHRSLVAPYDAVVIDRHREAGTVVKAGDPIFSLVADGAYWGLAHIDEAQAGFIAPDQPVEARLRSRPRDAFTGRVARIGLESDRVTEERQVFVRGDNPPPRIYLGEQVEFWITVAELDAALLVPEAVVTGFDGKQGMVWTVEDGRLQFRKVGFGHRTEDARLEIVEGLPEGADVVLRIENGFREGRAVRMTGAAGK